MPDATSPRKVLTIVVPAYNEVRFIAQTLSVVLAAAQRHLDDYEIIMIDDGSQDGTGDAAEAFAATASKVRVHRQPRNMGVGAAYLTGLQQARFPFITVVPGDNAFSVEALDSVFSIVGESNLIVSYRDNMEVRTPLRRALSIICTTMMGVVSGRRVRDAHSMFVFPVALARYVNVQPDYSYHIQSLGRLLVLVREFREVPAPLNPRPDANSGVMKAKIIMRLGTAMLGLGLWRVSTVLERRRMSGDLAEARSILSTDKK